MTGVFLGAILFVSGCADLTHFKDRDTNFDKAQTLFFVDAKQRLITTVDRGYRIKPGYTSQKNGDTGEAVTVPNTLERDIRLCAEPSPDALSALAAAQGFSLSSKSVETALNNSLAEGASSIGLRTQSIQLMRDAMYRLCEGYISGAIDDRSFQTMQRRFQSSMVAVLAIEQLTGTVRAAPVTISTSGRAGSAEEVLKLSESLKVARDKATSAESALKTHKEGPLKTAQDEYDKALAAELVKLDKTSVDELTATQQAALETSLKSQSEEVEKQKTELERLEQALKEAQQDRDYIASMRSRVMAGDTSVSADAQIRDAGYSPPDAEAIKNVAQTVENIVKATFDLRFSDELCTTVLLGRYSDGVSGGVYDNCIVLLQGEAELARAEAANEKALGLARLSLLSRYLEGQEDSEALVGILSIAGGDRSPPVSTPQPKSVTDEDLKGLVGGVAKELTQPSEEKKR